MQLAWRRHYEGPRAFSTERIRAVEHLDRPEVPPGEKARAHRDLETISRLPFQFRPLWLAVRELARRHPDREAPLRLLEIGAGTGTVGLRLSAALVREGRRVELISTDLRTDLLPAPSTAGALRVRPARLDALTDPIPETDIAVANLLIHHFREEDVVGLLARLRTQSRLGCALFDLQRSRWAFLFIRWTFPLWVKSPVTAADALISVQQAFRADELRSMALRAGVRMPRVERYLSLRSLLWWESEGPSSQGR